MAYQGQRRSDDACCQKRPLCGGWASAFGAEPVPLTIVNQTLVMVHALNGRVVALNARCPQWRKPVRSAIDMGLTAYRKRVCDLIAADSTLDPGAA